MNKYLFISICIFLTILLAANVHAEFYEYIDENGNVVLTDNAGNIPENKKSKIKKLDEVGDKPSRSHSVTSNGRMQNALTEDEEIERYIADLKRKGATEEQIQEIRCMIKVKREPDKVWSEKEKIELDSSLRLKWNQMRNALDRGDIDTAVSYFYEGSRDTYRKMYSSFSKQILSEMSRELSDIHMVSVDGNRSAIYEILCTRDGKKYSFQLSFVKDCSDEWKIASY